jgi:hypothetical protein
MTAFVGGQSIAWTALWGFWVFVSRHNHPNLRLNAVASAFLVTTFAAAVYANHLWLIPRLWRTRRYVAYGTALMLVMGLLALACTAAIHVAYDLLWGPDPARFGFLTNFAMEFALVAFHVAVVAIGVRVFRACPPPASPVISAEVSRRSGGGP